MSKANNWETPDMENPELKEELEGTPDTEAMQEEEEVAAAELQKLSAEREEYLNALIRERADFDNYKKRNVSAVSRAYMDGQADVAAMILPVVDNLERALQAEGGAEAEGAIKKGVEMITKQLRDVLGSIGVEEIPAEGKVFDPNLHNAVMQEGACEGEESGTVKEVLQKGYKIKDKVLRHSMVKVIQ